MPCGNLPESERGRVTLVDLTRQMTRRWQQKRGQVLAVLLKQLPELLIELVRVLVMVGIAPLLAGYGLVQYGLQNTEILPFSPGHLVAGARRRTSAQDLHRTQPAPVLVSTASSSSTASSPP